MLKSYYTKGDDSIKRIILFFICFILTLSPIYASVGAYNVHITEKYVYATAKCSCSLASDYKYHTRVFYNYDPVSRRYGVLSFEEGPSSWTSPEGMWYSTITDMDFCLVHGKSHDDRHVYLIPYNGVVKGKVVHDGYFTGETVKVQNNSTVKQVNRKQIFIDKFKNFDFWSNL